MICVYLCTDIAAFSCVYIRMHVYLFDLICDISVAESKIQTRSNNNFEGFLIVKPETIAFHNPSNFA